MKVIKGEKGCEYTFQDEFPKTVFCSCGGEAHIIFVAIEEDEEQGEYICNNVPKDANLWPHDAIAVAVYICKKCMKTISIMNQG